MSMQFNPEFRRQLWLQINATRLILAPVVIAIVVALLVAIGSAAGTVHSTAWGALSLTVLVWGTSAANASIREEITGRTWNQQRMSRLTPWQLTWGKLFGATSYVWYVTLLCALVVVFSERKVGFPQSLLIEFVKLLALSVFAHTVALMAPLAFQSGSGEPRVSVPTIAVFAFVFVAFQLVGSGLFWAMRDGAPIRWFGLDIDTEALAMFLALSLAAWGVLGAWRAMRQALQVRQLPWALPAFVAFMGVWAAGTTRSSDMSVITSALIGATTALAATSWALMVWEPQSLFNWQRIRTHWVAGERSRALANVSAAASLVVCAVIAAVLVAALTVTGSGADVAGVRAASFVMKTGASAQFDVAGHAGAFLWLALILLRDFAFSLIADTFTTSPRRRSAVMLLYLLFMYVAVPAALHSFATDGGNWWFPTSSSFAPIVLALVTMLAMVGALISRLPQPPAVNATQS